MGLKWLCFCLVSAAAFFVTYEYTKSLVGAGGALGSPHMAPVTHMVAASLGEIVSLLVLRFSICCLLTCGCVSLCRDAFKLFLFVQAFLISCAPNFKKPAVSHTCSPLCFFPTTVYLKWTALACVLMLLPFKFHFRERQGRGGWVKGCGGGWFGFGSWPLGSSWVI